jgi:hypothetical protein
VSFLPKPQTCFREAFALFGVGGPKAPSATREARTRSAWLTADVGCATGDLSGFWRGSPATPWRSRASRSGVGPDGHGLSNLFQHPAFLQMVAR